MFTAFTITSSAHTANRAQDIFSSDDNSMADFLKGIIEREGIKSYKVTYTDHEKEQSRTYFECTFPGNNFISFGESGNLSAVGFNLNHLIRYSVFKKEFKNQESVCRLELLF